MMNNTRGEWKAVRRFLSRTNFVNYELGREIVQKLGYKDIYGPQTAIVDAYSGAGVFSAALHNEIRPGKHVLMEPFPVYSDFLKSLQTPQIHFDSADPFRWSAFTNLEKAGVYSPVAQPRTQVNDSVLFTANLLHAQGEQLATQYLNCITNQNWLQRFGRVRLLLWMRSGTAEKLLAGPGEAYRHRVSCQREASASARVVLHQSPRQVAKPAQRGSKAYPALLEAPLVEVDAAKDFTKTLKGVSLIELTPLETQIPHLDEFEYVIRNLCMLSGSPLSQSLNALGPGAVDDLGPQLQDRLHLKTNELGYADFCRITDVFRRWPFKPTSLHDFYEQNIIGMREEDIR